MSKRPNYLGTFLSDMKEARRYSCDWRSAPDKAAAHRKFRRLARQLLLHRQEPPTRLGMGWYW
jgi:hypothetical protein